MDQKTILFKNKVLEAISGEMGYLSADENVDRSRIEKWVLQAAEAQNLIISPADLAAVQQEIADELVGFGPIQPLINMDGISEIMVNGPDQVFIERKGKLIETDVKFDDQRHLMRIIDRILHPLGLRVDRTTPSCDARLPDGSRVNVIINPISQIGPCLTIRKFLKNILSVDQLIDSGALTDDMAEFLKACVRARLNIIVSGNTSSGKTTLLNILSDFIPTSERIVTIEDAAELTLSQKHVIPLETRPPNIDGEGEVTARDLVRNTLRMRPDRIIVGEVRSGEALDMLQAMNTGHDGSITTLHGNSPRDALSRLETMTLMAGIELPLQAIRKQIAAAVDLIVHLERLEDGTRKIVNITEVAGMEGNVITLTDVFKFDQTGIEEGMIVGRMEPTGIRPNFMNKLKRAGFELKGSIFGAGRF